MPSTMTSLFNPCLKMVRRDVNSFGAPKSAWLILVPLSRLGVMSLMMHPTQKGAKYLSDWGRLTDCVIETRTRSTCHQFTWGFYYGLIGEPPLEGLKLWTRGWQTKSPAPGVGGGGSKSLKSQKCRSFGRGVGKASVVLYTWIYNLEDLFYLHPSLSALKIFIKNV